jgi:fibronectin-binding autotransporter adhesin
MKTACKLFVFQFQLIALLTASFAVNQLASAQTTDIWTGTGADMNWSTAGNWLTGVAPGSSDNVAFDDTGTSATQGSVNNVVDTDFTIASLTYENTNNFHTTQVGDGQTLTDTGDLSADIVADPLITTYTAITGDGGVLSMTNSSSTLSASDSKATSGPGNDGSHSTLDMSGLGMFTANISQILAGASTGIRSSGTIYLAETNDITLSASAKAIDIGDGGGNNGGAGSQLYLGQTNVINVNSIVLGVGKSSHALLAFNPELTGPVAYLRGSDGTGRISLWTMGDDSYNVSSGTPGSDEEADLSGGTLDALVDTLVVGQGGQCYHSSGGPRTTTGTFTMDAGTLNVNNLEIGAAGPVSSGHSGNDSDAGQGTMTLNGGTVIVNDDMVFGQTNSGVASTTIAALLGTLNINDATVLANQIDCEGGVSYINMTGGLLAVTNTMGSPSLPLNYLVLSSGATLQLSAIGSATPSVAADALVVQDGSEVINVASLPVLTGYPSQFPLITYTNADSAGAGNFSLGTLPGTFQGYITNDNVSPVGTIWLVVTNGPATAKTDEWIGNVNNNWDTTTKNWLSSGNSVAYNENDSVIFDDSAHTGDVTLTSAHTPLACIITNDSLPYAFSGSGSISGATGLEKDGTASATISETGGDNFTGGIMANNGTLVLDDANSAISGDLTIASGATVQLGNGDTNGVLPSGNVQDDGTLAFDHSDDVSLATPIAGAGGLTQDGSGTLTLSGANTYTGNTVVNAGVLALGTNGSISSSAQVTIGAATLDLTAASGMTALNSLSLNNSTLNLGVSYAQTPLVATNLSVSGSANVINVSSLPPIVSYPATVALISSPNSFSGNFELGSVPEASPAYQGTISESSDQTEVVLTLTSGPTGSRPSVTWSGVDSATNMNWSDPNNWQSPGVPQPGGYVIFSDVAAVGSSPFSGGLGDGPSGISGNINNIVDGDFTIGELNYSNVLSDYQNTLLADGVTLNVVGDGTNTSPGLFTVGSGETDYGTSAAGFVTIAGTNSTLNLNNTNNLIYVSLGSSSGGDQQATLDLSGLGTLNANVSQIFVGVGANSGGIPLKHPSGIMYLARTNNFTATVAVSGTEDSDGGSSDVSVDVGDADSNAGNPDYLYLGQENTIYADVVGVGRQKATATMEFNSNFNNPSAYFRGQDGFSPVSIWSLGDGVANSGTTTCTGTCDFTSGSGGSDGYVNALVDTMYVGRGANNSSGSGTSTGTLSFDDGIFNVNTIYDGYQPDSSSKIGLGTINVNTNATAGTSGTLIVNNTMYLGVTTGGSGASSTAGELSINGGTVQANTITCDTNALGTSYITLNGGTLSIANTVGAPGSPLTYLVLTGGTLELNVNGGADVTNVVATSVTTGGSTTIQIGALSGVTAGVTYPLISYTGADPFASLSLAPLPAGYAGTLVDDTADSLIGLQLTSALAQPPVITGISMQAGNIVISGTNGTAGSNYYVLTSTNVALPLADWSVLATNAFNENGSFSFTNSANVNTPQRFFLLQLQ